MNQLLDTDLDERAAPEHELTLGMGTILGVFFSLTLVCAAFFGLGYILGQRHAEPEITTDPVTETTAPIPGSNAPKPAAGEAAASTPAPVAAAAVTLPIATTPAAAPVATPAVATQGAVPAPLPQTATNGAFMVQIAAVSSQQIADIEVAALHKSGFNVLVRHEPQDQLLHIQLGPYLTHKDAEAVRANVESHGFNAIIK